MAPSKYQEDEPCCVRPSDRAIAFAIAVVRSKPGEVKIEQYISLLRQHVTRGRRENALSSAHRHLDRSSFWRAEYERTNEALLLAEVEAVNLRREFDALKAKHSTARASSPNKKRKSDPVVIAYRRSPKRAKLDEDRVSSKSAAVSADDLLGLKLSTTSGTVDSLLRSLYQMHASIKACKGSAANDITYHLVQAVQALPKIVAQNIDESSALGTDSSGRFEETIMAARRVVASAFVGFKSVSRLEGGDAVLGIATHAIVKMYQEFLSSFTDMSKAEAVRVIAAASDAGDAGQTKPAPKAKKPKPTDLIATSNLSRFTKFLHEVVHLLDAEVEANKTLFEGFTYCFFDKLGTALFTITFGHSRQPTLEAEILNSKIGDEIEDIAEASCISPEDLEQSQAKLAAPYLIYLLHGIMSKAPAQLGSLISNRTGKSKQSNKRSVKNALAIAAKDCLQQTLVNSIFGTEGIDENDPFMECLKPTCLGSGQISIPKTKDANVREWFQEEVWRLLGWEILARERN